jgi:flagellar biosynthesis/type III secretory pathway protein FliH
MGRLIKGAGRVVPAAALSARDQAARLLAEGAAARASLGAEAERRGFEAGLAAGREAALAEVSETVAAAQAYAGSVRARAGEQALLLARRMAEKIVGRALDLDPAVMADIVGRALAASRASAGTVVLRVHPEDLATALAERPRWAERLDAAIQLRVVPDPTVGRAGCVVETPVGRLDARLSSQLDAFERAVRGKG